MAEGTISGFVALVLVPDEATRAAAYRLAAGIVPPDAESVLAGSALPHVTLTQCALRDAPCARLRALVERIEARVRGVPIPLGRLTVFGGGFVFWCVEAGSPAREILQTAHEDALALADGALDPVANAAVVEATARLTGGDPVLLEHARRHGYAFAGERYLPHITLGYDARLAGSRPAIASQAHHMRGESVALARLGRYGVVESLVPFVTTPGGRPPRPAP